MTLPGFLSKSAVLGLWVSIFRHKAAINIVVPNHPPPPFLNNRTDSSPYPVPGGSGVVVGEENRRAPASWPSRPGVCGWGSSGSPWSLGRGLHGEPGGLSWLFSLRAAPRPSSASFTTKESSRCGKGVLPSLSPPFPSPSCLSLPEFVSPRTRGECTPS